MFRGRGGMGRGRGTLTVAGRTMTRTRTRVDVGVGGRGCDSGRQNPFSSSIVSSRHPLAPMSLNSSSLSSSTDNNPLSGLSVSDWVSVPSENEVEDAVSALQEVFGNELDRVRISDLVNQVSSDVSETDWTEPSLLTYNSRMLQANGSDRVYYAIHLLQTDPSVQRIVKSLSSDKAVWDAILNNEVVRELRESISADEAHVLPDGTAHSDSLTTRNVVSMFVTVKAKFMEVIEKITKIVNQLFQHAYQKIGGGGNGSDSDNLKEKLKACLMLTIMVLLVAMVNRANS